MADLREQLNAIAEKVSEIVGNDGGDRRALAEVEKELRSLAAQPAPAGEVALPEPYTRDEKFGFPYWGEKQLRAYGDARAAAAASRPATAGPEGWHVEKSKCGEYLYIIAPDGKRWISSDCDYDTSAYEIATTMLSAAPQPAAVKQDLTTAPEGLGLLVDALEGAMIESLHGEGFDLWAKNRGKLRNRLPESVGAIIVKMRAILSSAPQPQRDGGAAGVHHAGRLQGMVEAEAQAEVVATAGLYVRPLTARPTNGS